MKKKINIFIIATCIFACRAVQANTVYVVPVGTPTIAYLSGKLSAFGLIGALAESSATAESSKIAGDKIKSATNELSPQVYFASKITKKLVDCGRDASFSDQLISERTKYPDWVDTKILTDESALIGNDSDIFIEAFVDRLFVTSSLFNDRLLGASAIKVYDAHTKKLINQYRDYTLMSGIEYLHHYSSGSEQEKTDELVQATKNVLDYLAGNLAKNICSSK